MEGSLSPPGCPRRKARGGRSPSWSFVSPVPSSTSGLGTTTSSCSIAVIREDWERFELHIPGALRMHPRRDLGISSILPDDELDRPRMAARRTATMRCRLCRLLRHEGANAVCLDGGIQAWIAEGFPTERHLLPSTSRGPERLACSRPKGVSNLRDLHGKKTHACRSSAPSSLAPPAWPGQQFIAALAEPPLHRADRPRGLAALGGQALRGGAAHRQRDDRAGSSPSRCPPDIAKMTVVSGDGGEGERLRHRLLRGGGGRGAGARAAAGQGHPGVLRRERLPLRGGRAAAASRR